MRRRITFLRHGHADDGSPDFDRTLSSAGRDAATRAGRALARAAALPDLILTSAAPRALATAELAAQAAGYAGPLRVEQSLYLASSSTCRSALQALPAEVLGVWLVGHNPGLSELAQELCRKACALAPAEFASAEIEVADWAEL